MFPFKCSIKSIIIIELKNKYINEKKGPFGPNFKDKRETQHLKYKILNTVYLLLYMSKIICLT